MKNIVLSLALVFGFSASFLPANAQQYDQLFSTFRAETLSRPDKRFLQMALAFEGYYNGLLDGNWGPRSQAALDRYARSEFGTGAEDWHMAFLAFSFIDIYERDGWEMRDFPGLELSMLFPYRSFIHDPATDNFVNFRHRSSSLSYSVGILNYQTAQNVHDYAESTNAGTSEPYIVRQRDFAVTSVTQRDGTTLYVRSNFVSGAWHTILLSADRRHASVLNAVAASITVGPPPSIYITENGELDTAIRQTLAYIDTLDEDGTPAETVAPEPERTSPPSANSTGTGFVVSENGHVLTNQHVVDGCTSLRYEGRPATIVAVSEDYDLALLHVTNLRPDTVATFSPTPARLNSDVTVVGYPLTGILSGVNVTRGAVSSSRGFDGEVGGMQISAPVQPGNSGGPVVAADGEVVGVVVAKLDAQYVADRTGDIPQNVNFAIRGELAKLFLFQNEVEPEIGLSDEAMLPVDLAEQSSNFTGLIECGG